MTNKISGEFLANSPLFIRRKTMAKWIWNSNGAKADEYCEFHDSFEFSSGKITLEISVDTQYVLYINGTLAAFGQYADYPHDKIFDRVDITQYCKEGLNKVDITVWYYGETCFTYYKGNAALMYKIYCGEKILCKSDEHTPSRLSPVYKQHTCKFITYQQGFTFCYDATKENSDNQFTPSVIVDQILPLRERPCKKLILKQPVNAIVCKKISDTDIIFDLGKEYVGFIKLDCYCENSQNVTISFGEHITDGKVRRIIGSRDFSVEYITKKGENNYLNPFRRLGCRYIEVVSEVPLDNLRIALVPTDYPINPLPRPALSEKQNKIYDICIHTLHLCMHEHYEDSPWREQSLYTMDSRNQMLFGYYAFGKYEFARASLQLIANGKREDNMLSICAPSDYDYVIPSFTLHYFIQCAEYYKYSKDLTLLKEIYPKLCSISETFKKHEQNGLLPPFRSKEYWNFYEWTDTFSAGRDKTVTQPDLFLNTLYSIALKCFADICNALGKKHTLNEQIEKLNQKIYETFWNENKKIFSNLPDNMGGYSVLANSWAILCGAADKCDLEELSDKLISDDTIVKTSLSMTCFLYDALLKTNKEKYSEYIIKDIERIFEPMLNGSTVWETELGENDFHDAGSLCHGWSALPIYYYNILK